MQFVHSQAVIEVSPLLAPIFPKSLMEAK